MTTYSSDWALRVPATRRGKGRASSSPASQVPRQVLTRKLAALHGGPR
jgi:hypothetical protein